MGFFDAAMLRNETLDNNEELCSLPEVGVYDTSHAVAEVLIGNSLLPCLHFGDPLLLMVTPNVTFLERILKV